MVKCIYMILKKTPLHAPPGGFRQSLFWDVDPKTIDPEKHARYIIERILEFGQPDEISWMFSYYPRHTIAQVLRKERSQVNNRSRALWDLILT